MAKYTGHPITDDSALGGAEIERSFRFNDNDSAYLQRSPSSSTSGSSQKITISFWIKLGNIPTGTNGGTFFGTAGNSHRGQFFNQELYFQFGSNNWINTEGVFRDPKEWYHVVYVVDTTQGTTSNRQKIYVNGVLQGRGDTISDPSQNAYVDYFNNSSETYYIGRRQAGNYFDGYLAEIHFIDGYAYDQSYFGFTEQQTGIWRPKKVTGVTYGTNGFHLDFSDNSSITNICLDKSGNGNNFSPNNCNTEDSMLDTPTNNFAVMSPLTNYSGLSQGNLRFNNYNDSGGNRSTQATIALPKSGKWYWEARYSESTGQISTKYFGVSQAQMNTGYITAPYVYYDRTLIANGNNSENISHGQDWYNGVGVPAILGCAVNVDNNTVSFYHNNTLQGTITLPTLTSSQEYFFTWANTSGGSSSSLNDTFNFGADSTFQGQVSRGNNTDANGIGDFKYAPPSGHLALCSKNIPPNVPSIIRPQKHFKCITYTGDGSSDRDITGLEFKPDFVWIKNRQNPDWHMLQDSVRGANKVLYSNRQEGEDTDNTNGHVNYFNKDGFNVTAGDSGNVNQNTETYVAWCWKAGGAAVSNTEGSITSSVSANTEAGFSIVSYTGNGSNSSTVGHGLGGTPEMVVVKRRNSSSNWVVETPHTHNGYGMYWNFNDGSHLGGADTITKSSTLLTFANSSDSNRKVNFNGETYIAYCWRSIPGFSKFGKYTGNGSSDGVYVHLGFRPAWVTVKNTNASNNWQTWDTAREPNNVMQRILEFNDASTDDDASSNTAIDFLANGFKHRTSFVRSNTDGYTYLYMAFAEQPGTTPFNTSPNAR